MHVRTSLDELASLLTHQVGASLYVATETSDDKPARLIVATLLLATNAGWLPVYVSAELTVAELEKLDPSAIRVSEIAG